MKNDLRQRVLIRSRIRFLTLILIFFLAAGCYSTPTSSQEFVYVPPTPAVSRQAVVASPTAPPAPRPSPTAACTNNLIFVEDVTIPDGYQAQPGEQLDKRWEVQNSGSCNWDVDYSLRLISGENLGAGQQRSLYPARSGTGFVLQIDFTAPNEPGVYRSAWQAHDPTGSPFGDPIFIEIAVAAIQEP